MDGRHVTINVCKLYATNIDSQFSFNQNLLSHVRGSLIRETVVSREKHQSDLVVL